MANRIVPFGYEISNGEFKIINKEAEVIKHIFTLYVQGQSLRTISDRLNLISITYADDGRQWNKNMVKRILENKKYTGMNEYPAIIPHETAKMANEIKGNKYVGIKQEIKTRNTAYHEKCRCDICGSKMTRFHKSGGIHKKVYWKCANETCEGHAHWINEEILEQTLADILNGISEDLNMAFMPNENGIDKDEEYIKGKQEIERMLGEHIVDSKLFVEKALEFTGILFRKCKNSDNPQNTKRIEDRMALYVKKDLPDGDVIKDIVRRIRISPEKVLCVELINGKEFIREFTRKENRHNRMEDYK